MTGSKPDQEITISCLDEKEMHRADCLHCSFRHLMLFSPLDMENFSHRLLPISHLVSNAKTRIYHQGQPSQSVFSIRRGFIKLTQYSDNGKQRIVRLVGPGACIGLEALIGENYHQTAEAVTELDFCILPVKTIFYLQKEQPVLYSELQKQWQLQLNEADKWIDQLLTGTIMQRFCHFLLIQYQLQKLPVFKVLLISNQDIASILATSKETISRCITDLREQGILNRVEKRLYELDLNAAEALTNKIYF